MSTQIVILAAGMGTVAGRTAQSRRRRAAPRALDHAAAARQHPCGLRERRPHHDRRRLPRRGHRRERFPDTEYVYNERYDHDHTSKSLLRALQATGRNDVLWMNGDVVFDPRVLGRAIAHIEAGESFVAVNTAKVSDEEVKYTVSADGRIDQLSKQVTGGIGEAVGINYISRADKKALMRGLQRVDDQEYFEGGLELAIAEGGVRVLPMDISDLYAVEVDFAEDLERANEFV